MDAKIIQADQDYKGLSKLIRPVLSADNLVNKAELGFNEAKKRPKIHDGTAEKSLLVEGDTVADLASNLGPGLTTSAGKLSLDLTTKALVSPTIAPTWTALKADGLTAYNLDTGNVSNAKAIVVDKGVKIQLAASYSYPAPNDSQALPAAVSGSFGNTLPGAGIASAPLAVPLITANASYSVTLSKPKSGLLVSNGQVVNASGNDTTTDSISVNFQGRGVITYNAAALLTAAQIQTAINAASFQTSKARIFTGVSAGAGLYTYYLLDAALGAPTNVIQNGATPVFTAFQFLAQVEITNAAGFLMNIIVMRSNATQAFTGATLAFS